MHCSVERKLGKGYQKTLALGNEPPAPKSEIDSRDHTSDGRRIAGSPVVASWGTAKGLTAKDGTSDRVDREDIASHLFDPFAWSGSDSCRRQTATRCRYPTGWLSLSRRTSLSELDMIDGLDVRIVET